MPLTPLEKNVLAQLQKAAVGTQTNSFEKWSIACVVDRAAKPTVKIAGPDKTGGVSYDLPKWVLQSTTNDKSRQDSEVRVLLDLITKYEHELLSGHYDFVMLSSDGPCPSCRSVIKAFQQYYNTQSGNCHGTIIYLKKAENVAVKGVWETPVLYGYGDEQTDDTLPYKRL